MIKLIIGLLVIGIVFGGFNYHKHHIKLKYKRINRALNQNKVYNLPLGSVQYYNTIKSQGVYSCLNNDLLQTNWQYARDNSTRANSQVRGWDKIRNRKYNGMYMFHRTHLAPFRYTLLEDERVLVTATSELNCGLKPRQHFSPDINHWQNYTYDLIKSRYPKVIIDPIRPVRGLDAELSLEDFERLSTRFIKRYPNHNFVYHGHANYTRPHYPPQSVTVEFFDQTDHKRLFKVTLTNHWRS